MTYITPEVARIALPFIKEWIDLDHRVTNLFRVVRDRPSDLAAAVALTPYAREEYDASYGPDTGDPVEDARRFLVRVWMAHGGKFGDRVGWRHDMRGKRSGPGMASEWRNLPDRILAIVDRLRGVHIECRPALDVIAAADDPSILIYADPPYPRGALYERSARYYANDMTDAEHGELLDVLLAHPGPVLLSGYRCELYDGKLEGWRRVDQETLAYRNSERVESLWINPRASAIARQAVLPLAV